MMGWILLKNFIVCIFEVYVLMAFDACMLNKREVKIYKVFVPFIGTILLTISYSLNNPSVNLIGVPLIYFGITMMLYQGKLIKKLGLSISYYAMVIVSELLFAAFISLNDLIGYKQQIKSSVSELVMLLIMKNITFIIIELIGRYYHKKDCNVVKDRIFAMMMIQPITILCILISIFYADIQTEGIEKMMLIVGVFILLFSNIVVFYVFECLSFNMDKARKMEVLYTKSLIEKRHFEYWEKTADKHYELLHDIKKYIRTACELINVNENEDAIHLFADIGIKINEANAFNYSTNKILNAILNEGKETADRKKIRYQAEIENGLDIGFIKQIDTIAILGNLIDNAIEAAEKTEDGYVDIQLYKGNDGCFMVWEIRNNFIQLTKRNKLGYITTKKNKREHGIGLFTVEKLVLQYEGILKIKIKDNEFVASIMFWINKE